MLINYTDGFSHVRRRLLKSRCRPVNEKETFHGQIYAVTKGGKRGSSCWRANSHQGDRTVKALPTKTRQSVQTGFTDEPWPSLFDMCVGACFGSGAMRPASWQVYWSLRQHWFRIKLSKNTKEKKEEEAALGNLLRISFAMFLFGRKSQIHVE